ncbi:MAG: sigma 54-interacting transcriptional regulator, partial [Candidatus Zixiibacteriota bacterium]
YRLNQLENARDILEKALILANQAAPGTTLAGRVMRHLAELYLRFKNYRSAQRSCSQAWIIMEKAGNKVEIGALLRIKAIIAEADKREQESLKLYSQAIDLLDEASVLFEKAETLVAAGKSKLFTVRQRMTYLFRAEDFYNRFNLCRKQKEVEKLINEIGCIQTSMNSNGIKNSENSTNDIDYITSCVKIIQFKNQLPLIGRTDLPIILTGETGVGKDHLARYFHFLIRPEAPFVAINCASLPETLLESELFGFKKGAFTGAEKNKQGLFVAANGGVLLLDEIGDMPLSLQTKLLGVLENRKVVPLGSTTPVELDIKLIAATNKNLETMVEKGTFRRDLYFRINGVTFEIPPLRKRKEDIPMLLNFFMKKCNLDKGNETIPMELVRQFVEYDWPGNIRELSNKVKRLEVMAQMVVEGDLVELSRMIFNNDIPSINNSLFARVEQFERKIILEALLTTRGNKSEVARMLGIHEATVRTKLKRYNISLEQYN